MIIKGRSPRMRHASKTHKVALDCLFDRINLDPNIQIKYIDTKSQLADILTRENFTRDEWNHLLCLFNVSHFSSTVCPEAMAKERKKRFRSKIETTAESFGKRRYGNQDPWSAIVERDDRKVQPVGQRPKNRVWLSWRTIHWQFFLSTPIKVWWEHSLVFSRVGNWPTDGWLNGEPVVTSWEKAESQSSFCMRRPSTMEQRNPLWTRQNFLIERRNPLWSIKKEQRTGIFHWKRWVRVRIVKQGEWSTKTIFDECYRNWKTFYNSNVHP